MKRGYAESRLGQIHFAAAGASDNPPLVLLPQGGRTWRMFASLAVQLADTYRLYALDYPGSGLSDPLPEGATFEEIAAAFIDVLDSLGIDRTSVYGLHTGNKIAAAMAAGFPTRVTKVVLAGQSHSLVPTNERRAATVGRTRRKLLDATDAREQALVHWADLFSVVSALWWREDLMRHIAEAGARRNTITRATDELLASESVPTLYRANFKYDLQRDLARITAPTLVLEIATPGEDHSIGRQGPGLLSMIPSAELVTLEASDYHGITLEDRAPEVAAILRGFLSR